MQAYHIALLQHTKYYVKEMPDAYVYVDFSVKIVNRAVEDSPFKIICDKYFKVTELKELMRCGSGSLEAYFYNNIK